MMIVCFLGIPEPIALLPVIEKKSRCPFRKKQEWFGVLVGWAPDARFWNEMGGYPSDREMRAYHREVDKTWREADISETANLPGKAMKKTVKTPEEDGPKVVKTSIAEQSTQPKSRVSYQEINPKFLEALIKARKNDIRGNKEKKRPIVYGLYTGEDQSGKKNGTVGIQTEIDKTDPRAITGRQIETWIEARKRDDSKDTEEWHA